MQQQPPDQPRGAEDRGREAAAARRHRARDAAVVAQQRAPDVAGQLVILAEHPLTVAVVGLDLQQVVGVAVVLAGVKVHHLHQPQRTLAAPRFHVERRVLGP